MPSPLRLFSLLSIAVLCTIVLPRAAGAGQQAATAGAPPQVTERVVVTATVAPAEASTIARTVIVVTGDDIERLGLRSVIDALRFVPGVDARARGPRDVQTDFSIRGATFGQNLILADGMRLNDSQSGHHNGEIPLPGVAIDRIEVVAGGSSAVHGADGLGGTINVITRRSPHTTALVAAGEHGFAEAQVSTSGRGVPRDWTMAAWGSRSAGFMFDRDFALGGVAVRGAVSPGVTIDVRHQRRAFGANGFYGASPSKEWTDQTLVGAAWTRDLGGWTSTSRAVARNHGDHFRWDIARPGFAENRHRTNAIDGGVDARRHVGGSLVALGASASGDWVRSSNLGDREYARGSVFGELQTSLGPRGSLTAGLRYDHYSSFGASTSPSVGVVAAISPDLRARVSAARAFRVPTFTELYYTDPGNLGSPDLIAEKAWTVDGGLDLTRREWSATASVFHRWDEDVIDWIRATPAERWRSTNVRDVRARGIELGVARRWRDALVRVSFTGLSLDAPELPVLSKYVLEYARRQVGVSAAVPTVAGVRLAVNIDHRARRDGRSYELMSARLSRRFDRVELFVDGTNLLGESYREVAGVDMPGRWLTAGITVR
jgi:vitamin B12 transporter